MRKPKGGGLLSTFINKNTKVGTTVIKFFLKIQKAPTSTVEGHLICNEKGNFLEYLRGKQRRYLEQSSPSSNFKESKIEKM